MKNIEKYTNTNKALEAYNSLDFKEVPFDVWLECEYEEPHKPTLLEAAEYFVNIVSGTPTSVTRSLFRVLRLAVEREKEKPVRNCDRFATAEEAWTAFRKMCNVNNCEKCPFEEHRNYYISCRFTWLYSEAEK